MITILLSVGIFLASAVALSRWVPRHPRFRWLVIVLNLAVTLRYLWWRGAETLNWEGATGIALSLTVYVAELCGFLVVLHHYAIATRSVRRRADPPGPEYGPSVDVFVPTYNEGTDILYRTVVGCQAMDYPRKTIHVLDDGNRTEVAALCQRLGVLYHARPDNRGAKAGNLNHALSRTKGELVATFDADHVPVRTFLTQTVGFFRDEKVAQVQTAHHFYNPDLFQDRLKIRDYIANEQDMFYHVVQPGRDASNSSFFCGSGAVLRRSALAVIGGFPTTTVTEDLHTTMLLHSHGYRSVYVNKNLSAGLAPESYEGYLTQRRRWARGTLQVMLSQRGLLLGGLSLMQRINYLATLWYWLYGFPRVIYLVAPLFFLLGNVHPLVVRDLSDLLVYYVPHVAISVVGFQLVNLGMRRIFWSDVYESCISVQLALVAALFPFSRRKVRFAVTPKGSDAEAPTSWRMAAPMAALTVAVAGGIVAGIVSLCRGGPDRFSTIINTFWAWYNLVVLGMGVLLFRHNPQRRRAVRLKRCLPLELAWNGARLRGKTVDISETGVAFTLRRADALPDEMDVSIHGPDGRVLCLKGVLIRCDVDPTGRLSAAVAFVDRDEGQHRHLVELMFSAADSWSGRPPATMGAPEHLRRIVRSMISVLSRERKSVRRAPRIPCDLPATVLSPGGATFAGRIADISVRGAAVRLERGCHIPTGRGLHVVITWNDQEKSTLRAVVKNVRRDPSGTRILGIAFSGAEAAASHDLARRLYGPAVPPRLRERVAS